MIASPIHFAVREAWEEYGSRKRKLAADIFYSRDRPAGTERAPNDQSGEERPLLRIGLFRGRRRSNEWYVFTRTGTICEGIRPSVKERWAIGSSSQCGRIPYLWMIAGSFFTAWMGQLAHLLKDECDWRIVALFRGGLAFIFSLLFVRLSGARLIVWRPAALWLRGIASSISLLCTFYALSRLPTSEVMTLTNTFPIWVAFLSWPLFRIAPSLSVWLAALCGVIGVALIESPHFGTESGSSLAIALAVVSAATSAVAMLGLHRIQGVAPWAIVAHYSGVATIVVAGA